MGAVLMRVRTEFRQRWRSWLLLSLVVAVVAGTAIAAAAGARRTESAFPRFVATTNQTHVSVDVGDYTGDQASLLARIQGLPEVVDSYRPTIFTATVTSDGGHILRFPEVILIGDEQGRAGSDLDRIRVVEGRPSNPGALDEVMTNPIMAERLGLRPGSVIEAAVADARSPDAFKAVLNFRFRVVGIYVSAGEFETLSGQSIGQLIRMTPAFTRAHNVLGFNFSISLKLRHGFSDVPGLTKGLSALRAPREPEDSRSPFAGVEELNGTQVTALWLLCAMLVFAGFAVLGQAFARREFIGSLDNPTLRALGLPRSEMFAVSMVRTALILIVAAVGAIGVAFLLSPLAPIGQARLAEPRPGFTVDGSALAIGAIAVLLIGMVLTVWPAWRATRVGSGPEASQRPSSIAAAITTVGLPASATIGARLAMEPGRGRRAVPVRTAMLGTALAIGALAMSLGFAASVDRLIERPELSGYTFDAAVLTDPPLVPEAQRTVSGVPFVARTWQGTQHVVRIAGMEMQVFANAGPAPSPAVVAGRPARTEDEVLLDAKTMRILRLNIGDRVTIRGEAFEDQQAPPPVSMRIVGRFAVPRLAFQNARPDQGISATMAGARRIDAKAVPESVFVRFRPGTDLARASYKLQTLFGGSAAVLVRRLPAQLQNLSRIKNVSFVLALVIGVMGALTLVDALVSTIRRRSRDLAILKTLGFTRGQVRSAVAWQASVLIALAVPPALVVGVVAGRFLWGAFADRIGFVPQAVVPVTAFALATLAAVALANVVAAYPARTAARTRPALVLRTE